MSGKQPVKTQKKQATKPSSTLEVPRVLTVQVRDGILINKEQRNTPMAFLFQHCLASMNGRNDVVLLKQMAALHGVEVEVEE